eukprot:TRINITY_DN25598_c0_g1_i1.p1 TRINITY_DN25598_c0_g1~~TRINITY_DN25598_c0_g1_i1.p1  ORF type:complete len:135 (-),score=34.80 TRINITY_DN25598_c0_g1_i1:58-462(-)
MASESEEYGLSEKEVESEAFISDKEEDDGHEPEEKVEKRPRKVKVDDEGSEYIKRLNSLKANVSYHESWRISQESLLEEADFTERINTASRALIADLATEEEDIPKELKQLIKRDYNGIKFANDVTRRPTYADS